ncbi:hypothetical protein CR513_32138, partial [Mucuna pruriens]
MVVKREEAIRWLPTQKATEKGKGISLPRVFALIRMLVEPLDIFVFTWDNARTLTPWEALKTTIYILNRIPAKTVNKTPMNFGLTKSQASNTCTFGVAQLKHDLIGHVKEN